MKDCFSRLCVKCKEALQFNKSRIQGDQLEYHHHLQDSFVKFISDLQRIATIQLPTTTLSRPRLRSELAGAGSGARSEAGARSGAVAGAGARSVAGTGSVAGSGARSGAVAGAGAGARSGAGSGARSEAGAGAGARSGAGVWAPGRARHA